MTFTVFVSVPLRPPSGPFAQARSARDFRSFLENGIFLSPIEIFGDTFFLISPTSFGKLSHVVM